IPLQFELSKGQLSDLNLLSKANSTIELPSNYKYVKANPQETGFYRSLYSPALLSKLYHPIKNKELSVTDRLGVIRDMFAAAKSGLIPTSAYLEFLPAFLDEDSYIVWAEILSGMGEIHNLLKYNSPEQKQLEKYYRSLLKPVVKKVGWEADHKESQTRALLRSAVLAKFGSYGDKATIQKAKQILLKQSRKSISPDLRAAVYHLSALSGDEKIYKLLHTMFAKETLNEEQRRIARAMSSFKNQKLFKQTLDFTLSKQVRGQDAPIMIASALYNTANRDLAWTWLKKNWGTLHERYQGDHLLTRIIEYLNSFTDLKMAAEITKFFKANPVPAAERTIEQVLEQIRQQSAWAKRDSKNISKALIALNSRLH
ncbi:MAG TPA: ERAP1-like C-terminal domain-containing protein, partial [Patescibacteria group bacterium]|nr:ERAP1-like C-terminal domain-containing protein [Patescibacteria group bacterium]